MCRVGRLNLKYYFLYTQFWPVTPLLLLPPLSGSWSMWWTPVWAGWRMMYLSFCRMSPWCGVATVCHGSMITRENGSERSSDQRTATSCIKSGVKMYVNKYKRYAEGQLVLLTKPLSTITSCIFDSLGSLVWDILGFMISDAILNVPALSARLLCGVSDWIGEDKSKNGSIHLLKCFTNMKPLYLCIYYKVLESNFPPRSPFHAQGFSLGRWTRREDMAAAEQTLLSRLGQNRYFAGEHL